MINIDIPQFLQPLIFKLIILITNQTATSLLKRKTLYKAFTDEFYLNQNNRPSVTYLWVLGCKTYIQILKEHQIPSQKVAIQAEVGIFIGYKRSHIFKVYIPLRKGPIKKRIIQSLNIRFNKRGLITKPLLKDDIDVPTPAKNRGKSTEN